MIEPGTVIGRLTATDITELRPRPDGRNRRYQTFSCVCGNSTTLVPYSVNSGNTTSCGCLHTEVVKLQMTKHGLSKTSAYRVQLNKARRHQKRASQYGVTVERITSGMLQELLNEYSNQCWICSINLEVVHWDHVHPLSKGGAHVVSNLRPACRDCNGKKGAVHPFTEDLRNKIADEVRAQRISQAYLPDTDGLEVH